MTKELYFTSTTSSDSRRDLTFTNIIDSNNLGEEEAIYSWTAINFLKGDLLSESKGVGPATGGKEGTFGTLDLGGASSQIAFYVKNQGTFQTFAILSSLCSIHASYDVNCNI